VRPCRLVRGRRLLGPDLDGFRRPAGRTFIDGPAPIDRRALVSRHDPVLPRLDPNHQRPGLSIYLPGNGGLLYAVAMMSAGWDGGPDRHAPGFPSDGSWTVRFEGLRRAP